MSDKTPNNPMFDRLPYDRFQVLRQHQVVNQYLVNYPGIDRGASVSPNRSHDSIHAEWVMWSHAERGWVVVTSGREPGVEWWDGHEDHPVYTFEHMKFDSATGLVTRVQERYHMCKSCPGGLRKDYLYLVQLIVIDNGYKLSWLKDEHYTERFGPTRTDLPERVLFDHAGSIYRLTKEY